MGMGDGLANEANLGITPRDLEGAGGGMVVFNETIARESANVLKGPSGFAWRKCTRAELHCYNIRHVQPHAAQLSLRLRLDANVHIPWVSHAWKEA